MKTIMATTGQLIVVDDEDFESLSKLSWYVAGGGYAVNRKTKMHRLLSGVTDPKVLVDHINMDKLDNRKSNLRLASKSQNMANRHTPKTCANGYKGITQPPWAKGGWVAQITHNYKHEYLGKFPTKEEAAKAYDNAATRYFGEYALLNFPKEKTT